MINKTSMSIELASLITLVGVSALMTTVSLLPVPPVQLKPPSIPLDGKATSAGKNGNITPDYPKSTQPAATSR
jgi:hypothetical protein